MRGRATPRTGGLRAIIDDFAAMVAMDFDLLPTILSLAQPAREWLIDHGVNRALLSMAIAAQLGLDRRQTGEIGLEAALQDAGRLRVSPAIRPGPHPLSVHERTESEPPVLRTVDRVEGIGDLLPTAGVIGCPTHELPDPRGYPHRHPSVHILHYAELMAVADAYAAMVQPGPRRAALPPHEAVKTILIRGGLGRYDLAVVRAFLDCVSLFPVGSCVELDDGVPARVVRANPTNHLRPVVVEMNARGDWRKAVIDLSQDGRRKVVRALPTPGKDGKGTLRPSLCTAPPCRRLATRNSSP